MFSPGQQRYDEFIKIFKEANVDLTKENQYKKGQELWKTSGQNHQAIEDKSKRKSTLQGFWTKTVTAPPEKKQDYSKFFY